MRSIEPDSSFQPMEHRTPLEDRETVVELARKVRPSPRGAPLVVVEVGTWVGQTAYAIMKGVPRGHIDVQLFCVDNWRGNEEDRLGEVASVIGEQRLFEQFCKNMKRWLHRQVHPLRGNSLQWAAAWPADLPINFCFIDAAHDYHSVVADCIAWERHMADGGILCGHDFVAFPEVEKAVTDLYGGLGKDCRHKGDVWWTTIKRGKTT